MKTPIAPEAIEQKPFFHIPFWLAPEADIFRIRAKRFQELAEQESTQWQEYLNLLAEICLVQQDLYNQLPDITIEYAGDTLPLSPILIDQYTNQFDQLFNNMYLALSEHLNPTALQVWQEILSLSSIQRQALLKRVMQQQTELAEQDYAIWVNAILQVVYTHAAASLNAKQISNHNELGFCPCCGHDAIGAVIIGKGELEGLRYLYCDLCNSRWHHVRVRCSFCDHDHHLTINKIDEVKTGVLAAAEAECCPACHAYRKHYRQEKQQYADPIADDLASLALDILLSEDGWLRGGANPFLLMEKNRTH